MVAIICSLIWSLTIIYLCKLTREPKSIAPTESTDYAEITKLVVKLETLEAKMVEVEKLSDEAKRLMSNANLAMGFKPLVRKDK